MPEKPVFWLHSVSVVITAQFHNPSILNQDFLVSQAIVPSNWEVAQAVTTPAVSIVGYRNGIQLIVDEGKLTIVEDCKSSFQDEYHAHKVVSAYLNKLLHVPYRSLGLNCRVSMKQENPKDWLMHHFLKPGNWSRGNPIVRSMVPKFATKAGGRGVFFYVRSRAH